VPSTKAVWWILVVFEAKAFITFVGGSKMGFIYHIVALYKKAARQYRM